MGVALAGSCAFIVNGGAVRSPAGDTHNDLRFSVKSLSGDVCSC